MIKLIVSDLDGTLLDIPNSISKENLEAIEYAYSKGAKFCFATGRDFVSVCDIKSLLKHEPYLILGNGAQLYDDSGTLVGEEYFPNEYFMDILGILKNRNVEHMIFTTDGFYCTGEPELVRDYFIKRIALLTSEEYAETFRNGKEKPCNNLQKITDYEEFIRTKKIIKVEGFHMESEPIEQAKKDMEKYTNLSHLSTGRNNVEVTSIDAQKGIVLEKYLEKLGVNKDEVMVLGDSHNDLSLFEHFDISYAPDNSCDEIKDMAFKVVCSCKEHAVAEAIYDALGNPKEHEK